MSAASEANPSQLSPGATLEQELTPAATKTFQIQLATHQYVSILIDKGDLQLSVAVLNPRGEAIIEQLSRLYEPVRPAFITQLAGAHQIVIRSLEKADGNRNFQITVETPRAVTQRHQKATAAMRAAAEAVKLRLQWREEALRNAIMKYKEAATLWQSAGDAQEAARNLESIGAIHFTLSEYKQSLNQYQQALTISRSVRDRAGETRQLVRAGYVCVYLGQTSKSLAYSTAALKYFSQNRPQSPTAEEQLDEAFSLNTAGEAYYSLGKLRDSIDYFKRALALSQEVNDRSGQALANLNLGYSYSDLGELSEAQQHFGSSLSLYRTIDDRRGEALALTALGSVHSFIGEKQQALDLHTQAMNVLRIMGDHQGEAVALNSIGKAYEDLNQLPTALDNYTRALQIYVEGGNQGFAAVTRYYVGRTLNSLGKKEQALKYFQQSLLESQRMGQKRVAAYALSAISTLSSSDGHVKEALRQLHRGLQLYRGLGDRRGQVNTLNAIGNIYYSRKDNQRALQFFRSALPLSRAAADRKAETETLYNVASATSDSGHLNEAISVLEDSLKIIEALRSQVISPELRASYFAAVSDHWELYIDLLMRMHWLQPDKGFAALAFQASENARARGLIEILSEGRAEIRQGVDPKLLESERLLQQQMVAKAAYQRRLIDSKASQDEIDETEREILRLTNAFQGIQTQIKQQSPKFASLVQPQPLKLDDIQAELQDPDVLLEYSLGEARSYLWLVTRDSVKAYELPARAKIETAARNVYKLLTARQSLDENALDRFQQTAAESDRLCEKEAAELSQILLGPVASQLGSKRLIVVADGALQYLPFEALPTPSGDGPPASTNALIIMDHEVVNLPSASVLATLRHTNHSATKAKLLVAIVADPVFEKDDPRLSRSGNGSRITAPQMPAQFQPNAARDNGLMQGETGVSRLPATRKEAEAIMAETPNGMGRMVIDFDACRTTAMSGELAKFGVVHFATHGIIDTDQPLMSGIMLSMFNRNGQTENGFLQLHDIYNLDLSNTELTVLSACRTALGRDVRREGLIGLTRGFMYAGSKSVVASLWKVDDRATAELMKHFYHGMFQEQLTPAAALRKTKIAMLNQPRWHASYFWAAFTLQGEYRNEIHVPSPPRGRVYGLIAAVIALVVVSLGVVLLRARLSKLRAN